ncbi:hypothetical protein VKT23_011623 [Stygiomarasmius scandens]
MTARSARVRFGSWEQMERDARKTALKEKQEKFLSAEKFAVVGASADEKKYGYKCMKFLLEINGGKGVVPINPNASQVLGVQCLKAVTDLPDPQNTAVSVVVRPEVTLIILNLIVQHKLPVISIWLQPGAEDAAVLDYIKSNDLEDRCIYSTAPHPFSSTSTGVSLIMKPKSNSSSSPKTDTSTTSLGCSSLVDSPTMGKMTDGIENVSAALQTLSKRGAARLSTMQGAGFVPCLLKDGLKRLQNPISKRSSDSMEVDGFDPGSGTGGGFAPTPGEKRTSSLSEDCFSSGSGGNGGRVLSSTFDPGPGGNGAFVVPSPSTFQPGPIHNGGGFAARSSSFDPGSGGGGGRVILTPDVSSNDEPRTNDSINPGPSGNVGFASPTRFDPGSPGNGGRFAAPARSSSFDPGSPNNGGRFAAPDRSSSFDPGPGGNGFAPPSSSIDIGTGGNGGRLASPSTGPYKELHAADSVDPGSGGNGGRMVAPTPLSSAIDSGPGGNGGRAISPSASPDGDNDDPGSGGNGGRMAAVARFDPGPLHNGGRFFALPRASSFDGPGNNGG